jgi:threonyl-tRNA synthetase
MLIVGETEMELNQVSLRIHGQGDQGAVLVNEFIENFRKELKITG